MKKFFFILGSFLPDAGPLGAGVTVGMNPFNLSNT